MRRPPSLVIVLAVALGCFLFGKLFVADVFWVQEDSMEPLLPSGTVVLGLRCAYGVPDPLTGATWLRWGTPGHGDIVVFRGTNDGRLYVKRVLAVGGELVENRDGALYISGRREKPPGPLAAGREGPFFERCAVPSGMLFVAGDHRRVSRDSRHFGPVAVAAVVARVAWRLLPLQRFGMVR